MKTSATVRLLPPRRRDRGFAQGRWAWPALEGGVPFAPKPGWAAWLLAFLCVLLLATPAHAKRLALVVGNAAYPDNPLANPVNDAELMQRTLQGLGFEVALLRNASRRELLAGLRDFEAKAADAEVALFYFAGHGTQVAGNNYLIPLQAQIRAESDVPDEAVDAASVLRRIENARAKVGLVVLDACRDNPYAGASRSSARGLVRMNVPTGSIVAYATAAGSTADDGRGRNGVYTEQWAKHLATPGLDLREVFDRTAVEVERLTNGKQKPREDIGLRARVVLKPGSAPLVASVVPEPQVPRVPEPARPSAAQLEQQAWDAAQSAGTAAALQAYVSEFPRGAYAGVARVRLAALARPVQPDAVPQPAPVQAKAQPQPAQRQPFKPEMARIPADSFAMGSPASEVGRSADEGPQRRVNIAAFELGKTEVTQGQWKAVMGSNPSRFSECGDTCPVEQVSWDDVQQFILTLNQKTGQRYRLPSEAEWEYAARAGSTGSYGWGEAGSHEHANYGKDECCGGLAQGRDRWVNTAPVGQFPANAFGLYDMHGNVFEWVQDVWHDNYTGAPTDGSAWVSGGDQSLRVLRGGSWYYFPQILRSAIRYTYSPAGWDGDVGFRLARTVP